MRPGQGNGSSCRGLATQWWPLRPERLQVAAPTPTCLRGSGACLGSTLAAAPASSGLQQRARTVVAAAAAAGAGGGGTGGAGPSFSPAVAGAAAAVLACGVANRVLYRLALVPMRDHVFALAQFQNLGYLAIYFGLLWGRARQGLVTRDMLAIPKGRFVLTGGCEALAQLLLMAGAARLPGALLPLLMQTGLLWNVLFSALLLGTRPTPRQLAGVLLVLCGVSLASLSSSGGLASAAALVGPGDIWPVAFCVLSVAFPSLSVIVKESIFADARRRLGGRELDVLVVNAFGSAAQAAFVLLLLPLTTALRGLPLASLPDVLSQGARVLAGLPAVPGAEVLPGAPLFPVAYVIANICLNVTALLLVRSAGAVATSLAMAVMVPLSVAAFTLPLPLLAPAALGREFWLGSGLLMAGLAVYNWPAVQAAVGGGKAKGT